MALSTSPGDSAFTPKEALADHREVVVTQPARENRVLPLPRGSVAGDQLPRSVRVRAHAVLLHVETQILEDARDGRGRLTRQVACESPRGRGRLAVPLGRCPERHFLQSQGLIAALLELARELGSPTRVVADRD